MTYNKYTAPEGKVLFNTETFTYGNTMLSVFDLNLIILDEEEAERLANAYQDKQHEISEQLEQIEEEKPSVFKARSNTNVQLMALNEEGEYEETEDDPLLAFRKEKLIELMAKGINLNPKINKLKLNSEHI